MTSTRPETQPSLAADRAQTFIDWTRINAKMLTTGAVIVVVAAASYWFYLRSRELQAANAEKSLLNAKQSIAAGNAPLAQSDLQKVWSKYGSTSAGIEAALLLAQLDYDAGKYQDGIAVLKDAAGKGSAAASQSTIHSLIGDGYWQMGKIADAAKEYSVAAEATGLDNDRAYQLSKAARAYGAAGDTAKARQLWSQLIADPKAQAMAAEARVRLGELTAKVAGR